MSHKKALDYHDVLLYASDVELLREREWLNDQVGGSGTLYNREASSRSYRQCHGMDQLYCRICRSLHSFTSTWAGRSIVERTWPSPPDP